MSVRMLRSYWEEFFRSQGRLRREYKGIIKKSDEEYGEIVKQEPIGFSLVFAPICPPMLPACF